MMRSNLSRSGSGGVEFQQMTELLCVLCVLHLENRLIAVCTSFFKVVLRRTKKQPREVYRQGVKV